jgi:hypothetical protein
VVIKKLEFFKEWGSEKHIDDVKSILVNSKAIIDLTLLKKFVEKYRLEDEWKLVAGE